MIAPSRTASPPPLPPSLTGTGRTGKSGRAQVRPAVLVLIVGVLGCVTALSYVWVRLQVVELGYQLGRESRIAQRLDDENRRLRVQVESLKAPARLERIARETLGLVPPEVTEIKSLASAGVDHAALARR